MNRKLMILAVILLAGAGNAMIPAARGQNATSGPATELGGEAANWGLTPFAAIPTLAVRAEDRAAIRALEDQHIKERRAFEDKYETELRALVRKQAEEREVLGNRLAKSR